MSVGKLIDSEVLKASNKQLSVISAIETTGVYVGLEVALAA